MGSVHHVGGVCFDYSREDYASAAQVCGGLAGLYGAYLDAQLEMFEAVRPEVVGHFDLVRLHDTGYLRTFADTGVWARVLRNLEWVRAAGAILDVNARALLKGQPEPYVCRLILEEAARMGIKAAYGDDAHGVSDVGYGVEAVEGTIAALGMRAASLPGC